MSLQSESSLSSMTRSPTFHGKCQMHVLQHMEAERMRYIGQTNKSTLYSPVSLAVSSTSPYARDSGGQLNPHLDVPVVTVGLRTTRCNG